MLFRLTALILFSLLVGCSSGPTIDPNTAEGSFALAEKYEKDERYEEALAQFNSVKNKHPYSSFATEAKLKIADIHFKREDYAEAQAAYETFKELHPTHAKIDYATFRLGNSIFEQLPPTIDRDLSLADKAILYFDEVITSFANSPYVASSREMKAKVLNMLAEKELYVADFYFKRKKYDSALGRYEDLLQKYPGSTLTVRALKGAVISAYRSDDQNKAKEYYKRLDTEFNGSREWRETREVISAD